MHGQCIVDAGHVRDRAYGRKQRRMFVRQHVAREFHAACAYRDAHRAGMRHAASERRAHALLDRIVAGRYPSRG